MKVFVFLIIMVMAFLYGTVAVLQETGEEAIKSGASRYNIDPIEIPIEAVLGDTDEEVSDIILFKHIQKKNKEKLMRQRFVDNATKFVGKPYIWGGDYKPNEYVNGLDCSSLIHVSAIGAGLFMPRSVTSKLKLWSKSDESMGNLPLYAQPNKQISHVGIHSTNKGNEMIHASSSKGVEIRNIDTQGGYWRKRYKFSVILPPLEYL